MLGISTKSGTHVCNPILILNVKPINVHTQLFSRDLGRLDINMSFITPVATATASTAGLWFIPLLVATVSFYQYDKKDPEGRPYDAKVCKCKITTASSSKLSKLFIFS